MYDFMACNDSSSLYILTRNGTQTALCFQLFTDEVVEGNRLLSDSLVASWHRCFAYWHRCVLFNGEKMSDYKNCHVSLSRHQFPKMNVKIDSNLVCVSVSVSFG